MIGPNPSPSGSARSEGGRRELILYATPTGPLAEQCRRFFAEANRLGATTAQTYPPHCTLTGFFRRDDAGVARAVAEIEPIIAAAGPVPDGEVTVVGLHVTEQWVGLEVRSAWLEKLAAEVAGAHSLEAGDDALRLKDWLHLSLAYGIADLSAHGALAGDLVDLSAEAGWEVGLWERNPDASWTRHC